jgi:hypothetical protein
MAEMYGTRPSELVGVTEPWLAFCLDEALFVKLSLHRQDAQRDTGRYREHGFDPPETTDTIRVPWGGDGPDPLAAAGASL